MTAIAVNIPQLVCRDCNVRSPKILELKLLIRAVMAGLPFLESYQAMIVAILNINNTCPAILLQTLVATQTSSSPATLRTGLLPSLGCISASNNKVS